MDIFTILALIGGLALFLYGMDAMGEGLKRSAGNKLKTILGNLTSNKFKGFLLGLGVTAIIQSSSATTVMVVGFVNSGTMALGQAVGVIMGANLGTAVTSWITALNGIEGGADALAWVEWLKPDAWMPVLAMVGIALIMFAKKSRQKDIGTILMGFAVLMVGMDLMSGAVSGLRGEAWFQNLFTAFTNPILGVLVGTILTAVVQSSSASVGILQALSSTGAISFGAAIPIIMGQNIGTCVTALISAAGANKNGKRAAFVHLYYNIIGVVIFLTVYYLFGWILNLAGVIDIFTLANNTRIDMWGIALTHTLFKIFTVIILFWFTKYIEKLACKTVRGSDTKGDEYTNMLDERLLDTPAVAIDRSRAVVARMADVSATSLGEALSLFDKFDIKLADKVHDDEGKVDVYEDVIGTYLVKLSAKEMDESESHEVTKLLHIIGDFERISDHAANLVQSAEEIHDKNIEFSKYAQAELAVLRGAVSEIVITTREAFESMDMQKAATVEPLEQVVDYLKSEIKARHVLRLKNNECSIEHGFVLSDILTNLERISDHCSNIAGCLIEMTRHDSLGLHEYLRSVKQGGEEFDKLYGAFMVKYPLPAEKSSK